MTENSTRLGNNHDHKHTITEGCRGDEIWRTGLGVSRREQNINILLPHSNGARWLGLLPSSQVIYLILKVAKKWHSHWWEQACPQPLLVLTPASLFPHGWNLPPECLSAASVPSVAHQGIMENQVKARTNTAKTAFCSNPDLRLLSTVILFV